VDIIYPIIALIILLVIVLTILYLSVRVVQQYERMVVFRLGRTDEKLVKDPGLRFLIPIVDRPVKVDIREQFIEVPSQTTITKDNAPINVDFLIYWRIVDPLKSLVNVAYFAGALQGVATTTLRAVIGDILLDEVLSRRDRFDVAEDLHAGQRFAQIVGEPARLALRVLVSVTDEDALRHGSPAANAGAASIARFLPPGDRKIHAARRGALTRLRHSSPKIGRCHGAPGSGYCGAIEGRGTAAAMGAE